MSNTILIADDDNSTRKSMQKILKGEDYKVIAVESGQEALDTLDEEEIGLMIIAVDLPVKDGFEILGQVKDLSPDTQVILTTDDATVEDAVEALRMRAHDYLNKSVDSQELLSSVASGIAHLEEEKRKEMVFGQLENSLKQLKEIEGITRIQKAHDRVIQLPEGTSVDFARREMWRGNDSVRLTPTEGKLLEVFVNNWGRVMTHNELVFLVQGYEVAEWEAPMVLRPLISRLRKKLETFPNGRAWISSVRGTGYTFDPDRPGA